MKLTPARVISRFILMTSFSVLIFNALCSQNNPVCPIGVGTEPNPAARQAYAQQAREIYFQHFTKWSNLGNLRLSDDKKGEITLSGINKSRQIMGNNLRFQIPQGAVINGITLMIEGQSDRYADIDEVEIYLTGESGEIKGQNKKNTARLQKAWNKNADGTDRVWMYGSQTDTWGVQWTPAEINSPEFGYQLQIRTIDTAAVKVEIDQVIIKVDYTPAYSFCDDKCLVFYIDKYEQYGSYVWDYPEQFTMVSSSVSNQTIDLKAGNAAYGLYEICADVYAYSGDFAGRCCRQFLYQDCNSSEIRGMAWQDLNDNKLRNNGEGILSNVQLLLFDSTGTSIDTTLTNQFGNYQFSGIPVGRYYIKATPVPNMKMVAYNPSDPDFNSDITNANGPGTTDWIETQIGNTVSGIDFGFTPLSSIGDLVWNDRNLNGLQNTGEPGIPQVKVRLMRFDGTVYDSTTTDAAGKYLFSNVPANKYYLQFVTPQDFYPGFTVPNQNDINSDINPQGRTGMFSFIAPTIRLDVDAGYYQTSRIGDLAWVDKNGNGVFNTGEQPLQGVAVRLTGTAGDNTAVDMSATTGVDGKYFFNNVKPGVYSLTFTAPGGYFFTVANQGEDDRDSDSVNGQAGPLTVSGGQLIFDIDAGLYQPASISNYVWEDLNGNGVQDTAESGIANVKVTLTEFLRDQSIDHGSRLTDANGYYLFDNLKPGTFKLTFEQKQGYVFTLSNTGTDDTRDSDPIDGMVTDIMLMSGEQNDTYDAGMLRTGSLGDMVWEDNNANGIRDSGEPGIAGVSIQLAGMSGAGSSVSLQTVTDASGVYKFSGLQPGVYTVTALLPAGFRFTKSDAGSNDVADSDGINGVVTGISVSSGTLYDNIDFGMFRFASLGDQVWEDINANGIRDAAEVGVSNVTVSLSGTDGAGQSVTLITTTDNNGFYSFGQLVPGTYNVSVLLPAGYRFSVLNAGNDETKDSDINNTTSPQYSLMSGVSVDDADAGIFRTADLGNLVWHDLNANGLLDAGEPGLAFVKLTLEGTSGAGVPVNLMTTTDSQGIYTFGGIEPGNYRILVESPAGYEFTLANAGNNDDLDSDVQNGEIANITVISGGTTTSLDAGLFLRGSVGDFVWLDANGNGIQDAGETGIAQIPVSLAGTDGFGQAVLRNIVTDDNGYYLFDGLVPGNYNITFSFTDPYNATLPNATNDDKDSDLISGPVSLALVSGQQIRDVDAGLFTGGSVGNFVWEDLNANGIQDAGEPGIPGVEVVLTGPAAITRTTQTDASGFYNFAQLSPGIYSITLGLDASYITTVKNSGSDSQTDSDAEGRVINGVSIVSGLQRNDLDAGFFRYAGISGQLWEDKNGNEVRETGESPVAGASVTLTGTSGAGVSVNITIATSADGTYAFGSLVPGDYSVTINSPAGSYWVRADIGSDDLTDSDVDAAGKASFTLVSNAQKTAVDCGLVYYASLGDFVWLDANGNGIQDNGESGLSGIEITLSGTDGTGNSINRSTTSGAGGLYHIDGLKPGLYNVTAGKPSGYDFSPSDAGSDDLDSDGIEGTVSGVMVMSGTMRTDLDFGFVSGIGIGDFVWEDLNANGIQDAGEPGIPGITLSLSGTASDGSPVAQTTVTGPGGNYFFTGIYPGTYTITVSIPTDLTPTRSMAGSNQDLDSNLSENSNTWSFTVASVAPIQNLDFGLVRMGSVGDLVWEDLNCDGVLESGEPGIEGMEIRITGVDLFGTIINRSTTTDASGHYLFSGLKPGSYLLDFIVPQGYELSSATINVAEIQSGQNLLNLDAPVFRRAVVGDFVWNDLNSNGAQDPGEPGIEGVPVTLTNLSFPGMPPVTVVTDAAGYYMASGLKPGTYSIHFEAGTGFEATLKNVGNDDGMDSDINSDGRADDITLKSGDQYDNIDAGFVSTATSAIGDFVWEDLNGDGIQDPNEPGVPFVTVRLSGTTTSGATVNLSTQTDFGGLYTFSGLAAGSYEVMFEPSFIYKFTKQNAGSVVSDSDANPATGSSGVFLLGIGETKTDIDAGVYSVSSIGDQVWNDLNRDGLRDAGEPGIPGVELLLLDAQDNILASAVSADFGFYFFTDLAPGTFRIKAGIPTGLVLTDPFGPDPDNNSDFTLMADMAVTELIQLPSNTFRYDIDLGLKTGISSVSGYAWFDADGDGIRGTSESVFDSIPVYLLSMTGDTLAVDTTDLEGSYSFTNALPGSYRVGFPVYGDSTFTIPLQGTDPLRDSDVANADSGTTSQIDLVLGQELLGINAGYSNYGTIGNYTWLDANEDGLQTGDEVGINNIKVYLLNSSGTVIDSTLTVPNGGNSGYYLFRKLRYGNYKLKFELKDNFRFTGYVGDMPLTNSDVTNPVSDTTAFFYLAPGQNRLDIDAGYILLAPVTGSLEGLVWQDNNNTKLREGSDIVLGGITVTLFNADGTLVATTTSGSDGAYRFDNLPFGDYYVKVPAMQGKLFVLYNGVPRPGDSDITNAFGAGSTRLLTIFPGDTLREIDMGYAPVITIGDFVWHDLNNNGLQDTGEPGLANIKVRLFNEQGVLEKTVTSGADGRYNFTDVPVGKYTLEFERLTDYVFAVNNNSDPARNSDPNLNTGRTSLLDFSIQQSYTAIDAGYLKGGKIGDILWLDINSNGAFQAGEPGISNIKVRLFDSAGVLKDSTITTSQPGNNEFVGYYQFTSVRPGSYFVKFDIPQGYLVPVANLWTPEIDNDISGANGPFTTDVFTVASNQVIDTIDGAAYIPATLGDRVWNDVNQNGIQDAGEPGVPGITVNLFTQGGQLLDTHITDINGKYQFGGLRQRLYYLQFSIPDGFEFTLQNASGDNATDSDVDPTGTTPLISLAHGSTLLDIDAGIHITSGRLVMGNIWNDTDKDGLRVYTESMMKDIRVYLKNSANDIVDEFTTNHAGMYCLKTLNPGDHYVFVEAPENHILSNKNAGSNPEMDCDFNPDGRSDMITLGTGFPMKYVDAGLYFKLQTSLNGLVWKDINKNGIRDAGDQPMPNVVIFLFNKWNIFIKSTKTNENGEYSLKNLDSGQYYCRLPEYPDLTYVMFTGNNPDVDSEFTNQYGQATSRLVTMVAGTPLQHFDFGYRSVNGIHELTNDDKIREAIVYPNPTIGDIRVRLPEGQYEGQYYIINAAGQVVLNGIISSNDEAIDLWRLPAGRYAIHIKTESNSWKKAFTRFENR